MDEGKTGGTGYAKPTYDGRLVFFQVLEKLLLALNISSLNSDHYQWYRNLHSIFTQVKPFLKPTEADKIKASLLHVRANIECVLNRRVEKNTKNFLFHKIDLNLLNIQEELFMATKDLMLTSNSEDTLDFSEEELEKLTDF